MEAKWYRNLEHCGIQIEFPCKPSQDVISALKSNGFRWARFNKVWYSKGHQYQIDLANKLAEYGGEIGKSLTFAEKMEAKEALAEARSERYETYAENSAKRSDQLLKTASDMADVIPLGQPILVGHYSEGRDRKYRSRIQRKFEKGFQESDKADYFSRKSKVASEFKDRTFNLSTTLRRLDKLKASIRSIDRRDDTHIVSAELDSLRFKNGLQDERFEYISREFLLYDQGLVDKILEEVYYWQTIVDRHKDDGMKVFGPVDFQKGETIIVRGSMAKIKRVNQKTLSVEYIQPGKEWMNSLGGILKVSYDCLDQNCKEVGQHV